MRTCAKWESAAKAAAFGARAPQAELFILYGTLARANCIKIWRNMRWKWEIMYKLKGGKY